MELRIELDPVRWWHRFWSYLDRRRFKRVEMDGGQSYKDSDLVYAAYERCLCGAGMAYPKGCGMHHCWDCSDILTGRAVPSGQVGSVKHSDQKPFVFWNIKSEQQPSAGGATTRRRM